MTGAALTVRPADESLRGNLNPLPDQLTRRGHGRGMDVVAGGGDDDATDGDSPALDGTGPNPSARQGRRALLAAADKGLRGLLADPAMVAPPATAVSAAMVDCV